MCPSNGNNWPVPVGMRDWPPPEAGKRRKLINTLLDKLALSGYQEIATPLLEYYQVLTKGETGAAPDNLYKLLERDGSILALRPEVTTPIARIIGGGKMPGKPPWRLMYGQEVFRYELVQAGRQRGFSQVGVELIGEAGPQADCEILALAISTLRESGLQKFTVSLGHMGVLKGLLSSLSWEQERLEELKTCILEKDFVGLSQLLEQARLDKDIKDELINLLTRPLTVAELKALTSAVHESIRPALQELAQITDLLDAQGYLPYLQIDLSTLRAQDYYTGMVFEIYTSGIGYPIGGGGRYDQLLQHFGRDLPSTGFALGVERIMLSMEGE